MRAILYRGALVAAATPERVYLRPDIAALEDGHPLLRFIAVMCLYSRDVDTGAVPGPYSNERAELYARCVLIGDDDLAAHRSERDEQLAQRYGVPLEQVAAKRRDG